MFRNLKHLSLKDLRHLISPPTNRKYGPTVNVEYNSFPSLHHVELLGCGPSSSLSSSSFKNGKKYRKKQKKHSATDAQQQHEHDSLLLNERTICDFLKQCRHTIRSLSIERMSHLRRLMLPVMDQCRYLSLNQCRNLSLVSFVKAASGNDDDDDDKVLGLKMEEESCSMSKMEHMSLSHTSMSDHTLNQLLQCHVIPDNDDHSDDDDIVTDTVTDIDLGLENGSAKKQKKRRQILCQFPSLRQLDMNHCDQLVDPILNFCCHISHDGENDDNQLVEGQQSMTTMISIEPMKQFRALNMSQCKQLRSLTIAQLYHVGQYVRCVNLSHSKMNDFSIQNFLVHSAPHLEQLNCSSCHLLRRLNLPVEMDNTSATELRTVDFSACSKLESIRLMWRSDVAGGGASPLCAQRQLLSLSSLEEITLDWTSMTDDSIQHLLRVCPGLKRVSLRLCDHVVSPRLKHEQLQCMSLFGCLSLRSVGYTRAECPQLRELDVTNCINLASHHDDG